MLGCSCRPAAGCRSCRRRHAPCPRRGDGLRPGGRPSPSLTTRGTGRKGSSSGVTQTGPAAGAAAAVGGGKGFVQVEMQHVHAGVTDVDDAHDGVHVGTVAVDQPPLGMNDVGHLTDIVLEQPQGVGVGDHDAGSVLVHELGHRFGIRTPSTGLNWYGGEPHRDALAGLVPWAVSGISTLERGLPWFLMVGGEDQHSGHFALGAGSRLKVTAGRPVTSPR
jgi:hypothetical protein